MSRLNRVLRNVEKLPFYLSSISNIGIDTSDADKVRKNKLSVGRRDTSTGFSQDLVDDDIPFYMGLLQDQDVVTSSSPYYNPSYKDKRKKYYQIASHPEISHILQQYANEAIVNNDHNYFCDVNLDMVISKEEEKDKEIKKKIRKRFKQIYQYLNFDEGLTAWEYYLKWKIEGFLAFEIVFDDKNDPKEIAGFVELDPAEIYPVFMYDEKTGQKVKVWVEEKPGYQGTNNNRIIPDDALVFINHSRTGGPMGRISFVEYLERSFNMMRIMEVTKVGWHIMNSQYRLKVVMPVGTKSTAKAKQALAKVANKYREDLLIDDDNGQWSINGEARINFGKTMIFPSRGGNEPQIDGVTYNGPDLSNMEGAEYFDNKFHRDSGLPFSRFDRENGGGSHVLFENGGVPYDEISFHKAILRDRTEFKQLILKPLFTQCILDYPELKEDREFKSKLGLKFESEHHYERAKQQEVEEQVLRHIDSLQRLEKANGKPVFSTTFLLEKYWFSTGVWDKDEKKRNEEMLKKEEEENNEDGFL